MKVIRRTKKEVYKRWIKALRSGEYKQSNSRLRSGSGFCCLGVLCDLAAKDGGPQWDGSYYGPVKEHIWAFPDDIMVDFMVSDGEAFSKLAEMNDNGKSFKEIADYIENCIMPVECK